MVEIKIPVTSDILRFIAYDLKKSEKRETDNPDNQFFSAETSCFLQNVIKNTICECERLQTEVDNLIDAGVEAASILAD